MSCAVAVLVRPLASEPTMVPYMPGRRREYDDNNKKSHASRSDGAVSARNVRRGVRNSKGYPSIQEAPVETSLPRADVCESRGEPQSHWAQRMLEPVQTNHHSLAPDAWYSTNRCYLADLGGLPCASGWRLQRLLGP
jgi:hypothetical protein